MELPSDVRSAVEEYDVPVDIPTATVLIAVDDVVNPFVVPVPNDVKILPVVLYSGMGDDILVVMSG